MNLDRILEGVGDHLGPRGPGARQAARVACLDYAQGPRRGCVLLVFDARGDAPAWVVKAAPLTAARLREGRSIYEIEFDNLRLFEDAGINTPVRRTPAPVALWRDGDWLVTVQTALEGDVLKNLPGSKLFGAGRGGQTLDLVLDWWLALQRDWGVDRRRMTEARYDEEVLEPVRRFSRRFLLDEEERRFLARRFESERRLAGLEVPFTVEHGDFCPANMVLGRGTLGVFDWEFPLDHRLPLFDLYYLFASLRYPFHGWRGESRHFDSFVAMYWGDDRLSRAVQERVRRACDELGVPAAAAGDLFVLALIRVANLKYEALIEIHGEAATAPVEGPGAVPWTLRGGRTKDVPFALIRGGVFENLRWIVRRGMPAFLHD